MLGDRARTRQHRRSAAAAEAVAQPRAFVDRSDQAWQGLSYQLGIRTAPSTCRPAGRPAALRRAHSGRFARCPVSKMSAGVKLATRSAEVQAGRGSWRESPISRRRRWYRPDESANATGAGQRRSLAPGKTSLQFSARCGGQPAPRRTVMAAGAGSWEVLTLRHR